MAKMQRKCRTINRPHATGAERRIDPGTNPGGHNVREASGKRPATGDSTTTNNLVHCGRMESTAAAITVIFFDTS